MDEGKIKAEVLESNEKPENMSKNNDNEQKKEENWGKSATAVGVLEKNETNEDADESPIKSYEKKIKKDNKSQYQFHKAKKQNKMKIIIISIIIVTILLLIMSTIFAIINFNNSKILKGISIRNILVEGMTQEEATKMLNEKLEYEKTKALHIKVGDEIYNITPDEIETEYNVQKAVEEAYNIGRNGNIFKNNFEILSTMFRKNNIVLEVKCNETLLNTGLINLNANLPKGMRDNTYCIEEDKLIITRGTAGEAVNVEEMKKVIMDAIKNGTSETIEIKTQYKECPEIDIDKIYSEVKTEPQDASYKKDPFEIIPHKNGIDFDLEKAREMLKENKEEYIIDLIIKQPKVLTNQIGSEAFPDLLSSFSTKYDESNRARSNNLKIAMSKLDGYVVMPGETFSYNKSLGKRTVEDGYQYANGFASGKVVPMLAGGICQISSTLYDAILYANLEVVERHNHMFQATYVEPGKDATVVYGSLDFKFKNTRSYPIMIKTKTGGGLAEIKIFGIKEAVEYEIEIVSNVLNYTSYKVVYEDDSSLAPGKEKVSQWGLKGCSSKTYRIVKLNGQEVSRELLSKDTYKPLNKIIKRGPAHTTSETDPTESETATQPISKPKIETEPEPTPEPTPELTPEQIPVTTP